MSNSKYQEAKDNIVNTLARQIDYKTYKNLYSKDFDTLQELVDKATPKKIRYENVPKPSMAYMYSCPNCGRMLGVNCKPTYINYCDVCGIKLDWSDSDEKDNR